MMRSLATGRVNLASSLTALRANGLRSILTVFGVMIGVLAVTMAVSIGEGAKISVARSLEAMGSNMALVFPQPDARGGRRSLERGRLVDADVLEIAREVDGVVETAPQLRNTTRLSAGGRHASTMAIGTVPGYSAVTNSDVLEGRFVTQADVRSGARVVVLGRTVATAVFPDEDPIGRTLMIERTPFEVVGTLREKGSSFGRDNDDLAVVPLTTARQRFASSLPGPTDLAMLFVGFEEGTDLEAVKERIVEVLRRRNRVRPGATDPFTVTTTEEYAEQTATITGVFQTVLVAIAAISLLVGGVGIMNIMLISVTERTREIGLRMAVGARRGDIRNQFLTEAAILCLLGGCVGLAGAFVSSRLFERFAGFPAPIGWTLGAGSLVFSALLGIVFGGYPAIRAARLSPIDARRTE